MAPDGNHSSRSETHVLLIEADPNGRQEHSSVLEQAGYAVRQITGLPADQDLDDADLILSDPISFEWLRERRIERPIVVLTDDLKAGIAACLCGASDWVPVRSGRDYLLDVVREATTRRVRSRR